MATVGHDIEFDVMSFDKILEHLGYFEDGFLVQIVDGFIQKQ